MKILVDAELLEAPIDPEEISPCNRLPNSFRFVDAELRVLEEPVAIVQHLLFPIILKNRKNSQLFL